MDGVADGVAGLNAATVPVWDRYGHWSRPKARLAALLLAVFIVLAAWAPGLAPGPAEVPHVLPPAKDVPSGTKPPVAIPDDDGRDNDLRLYKLVAERVKRGDNYYVAATELQRANSYPVAPGLTVRLPTLAYLFAWIGQTGMSVLAWVLVGGALLANWRRFGTEPGGETFRMFGAGFLFFGLGNATHANFLVLHEVWSGLLMALALGLHRPSQGKWLGAFVAGAAALAIRELALPFVLLMAAYALWRRQWREGAAWGLLAAVFLAALAWHVSLAEAQIRIGDPISPPWLVLGGLPALLYKVIHSCALSILPVFIAGPLVILALFGWTSWKSPMGSFASLLTLGYATAFMIAGRDNNFYWGVILVPVLVMGLAMAPFALKSLWRQAIGGGRAFA